MSDKLLYRIKARFVKIEKIGQVPEGERTNFHFLGEIAGEELSGNIRGIDYALTRDGLVHAHIHEVVTTEQGEKISLERTGKSIVGDDPDNLVIEGHGRAQTSSERLAYLNNVEIMWKAYLNRQTIEFTAEVFQQ